MKLSDEEEKLVLELRAKKLSETPLKSGVLKHNIYKMKDDWYTNKWLFSSKDKEEAVKDFKSNFELVLKAGSEFVYYEEGGWYDSENYGIEGMSDSWGDNNLKNVKKLR